MLSLLGSLLGACCPWLTTDTTAALQKALGLSTVVVQAASTERLLLVWSHT